jgi:hypothetical protein
MYGEERAGAFSLRVFDCHERLFDELAAGDFLAGEKLRKLDDGHSGELTSLPALRENGLDAPNRGASQRKSTQASRVLQKVTSILIHACPSSFSRAVPRAITSVTMNFRR